MSLGQKILIGVCLGILAGIFFGEMVRWLDLVGDIYVGLLQMTVLPYVTVSLIERIGRADSTFKAPRLPPSGMPACTTPARSGHRPAKTPLTVGFRAGGTATAVPARQAATRPSTAAAPRARGARRSS